MPYSLGLIKMIDKENKFNSLRLRCSEEEFQEIVRIVREEKISSGEEKFWILPNDFFLVPDIVKSLPDSSPNVPEIQNGALLFKIFCETFWASLSLPTMTTCRRLCFLNQKLNTI